MKGLRLEARDPVDRVLEHSRHRGVVLRGGDHERVRLLDAAPKLVGARGKPHGVLLIAVVRTDGELSHRGEFGYVATSFDRRCRQLREPRVQRIFAQRSRQHEDVTGICGHQDHDDRCSRFRGARGSTRRRGRHPRPRLTVLGERRSAGSRQTSGSMEAAGIEPASAVAPGRASTSVTRFDLTRTAGSQATYRRASHPVVSPLRRLALLRGQPVI